MGDPDVLAHGLEDAECIECSVQTALCPASGNLSSRFSFEANTILQSWECASQSNRWPGL